MLKKFHYIRCLIWFLLFLLPWLMALPAMSFDRFTTSVYSKKRTYRITRSDAVHRRNRPAAVIFNLVPVGAVGENLMTGDIPAVLGLVIDGFLQNTHVSTILLNHGGVTQQGGDSVIWLTEYLRHQTEEQTLSAGQMIMFPELTGHGQALFILSQPVTYIPSSDIVPEVAMNLHLTSVSQPTYQLTATITGNANHANIYFYDGLLSTADLYGHQHLPVAHILLEDTQAGKKRGRPVKRVALPPENKDTPNDERPPEVKEPAIFRRHGRRNSEVKITLEAVTPDSNQTLAQWQRITIIWPEITISQHIYNMLL